MFCRSTFTGILLIIGCAACVDRITIPVPTPAAYPVVIDGFISDEPGPYLIKVTQAFDIESKSSFRIPISVKSMTLRDNQGITDVLTEKGNKGFYYTNFITGVVGRVYTLHIELLDGRIYESKPDTLYPSGVVEKVYYTFRQTQRSNGTTEYGYDIYFDATSGSRNHYNFLWKFNGLYQTDIPCCTCLADLVNPVPVVSNDQLVHEGKFKGVKAMYVPVTGWTFQHGVYAKVSQRSLSRQAYDFWRIVGAQLTGTTSLFQPITGKVPNNFTQIAGQETPLYGLFYATSSNSNGIYIDKSDVPRPEYIPVLQLSPATANYDPTKNTCQGLFPNSITLSGG